MAKLEDDFREGKGYEQTTDMGLIYQAQSRQTQGWVVLADLYMPMVYRWSRQKGLQPADASDIVQQVFAKLWSSIHQFSKASPNDSFRAWLRTITKNEILNNARTPPEALLGEPLNVGENRDSGADEERPRDVAMDLGLSATAVRQARFRVVSFLRKELGAFNKG